MLCLKQRVKPFGKRYRRHGQSFANPLRESPVEEGHVGKAISGKSMSGKGRSPAVMFCRLAIATL